MNGMMIQAPIQMDKMVATPNKTSAITGGGGKFGAVLATLQGQEGLMEAQVSTGFASLDDIIQQLLTVDSADELLDFLQANGLEDIILPEMIGDHLLIQDEKVLDILTRMLVNFKELVKEPQVEETSDQTNLFVDVRDLLAQLEEKLNELFQTDFPSEMFKGLSDEEIVVFVTVSQLVSLEASKVDMTSSQEQQLQSLEELMKNLGQLMNKESEIPTQTKAASFQEMITANKVIHQLFAHNQTTHPLGMELNKVEGESQATSRTEVLLKELQNIFKRANFGQTGGTNRISIRLYPEHLGQLRIELLQTNGLLTARILASNALGKDMLESQLHQLRQAFLHQNIQVERIDISQMLTETPQEDRAFNQHFKQRHHEETQDQNSESQEEEHVSFQEYMIELEG